MQMFKKLAAASLLVISMTAYYRGQAEIRLDSTKPNVYLSHVGEKGKRVITMSLSNNSLWPIRVCMRTPIPDAFLNSRQIDKKSYLFLKDGGNYKMCYGVFSYRKSALRVGNSRVTVSGPKVTGTGVNKQSYGYYTDEHDYRNWLAPGDSVGFDVPSDSLIDGQALYVSFEYVWDIPDGLLLQYRVVEHRVSFFDFQVGKVTM